MAVTVCQNCGSRRLRADRSMAGRLICQNCGIAAGNRAVRSTTRSNAKRWLVILLIAVIVLVVVTS